MKSSGSDTRRGWLVRNFWLLTMLVNLVILFVFLVVLIIVLS